MTHRWRFRGWRLTGMLMLLVHTPAGGAPTNATISAVTMDADGPTITWPAEPAVTYSLQSITNLTGEAEGWQDLTLTTAPGTNCSVKDFAPSMPGHAFYR